jgi:hypothetical protein
MVKLWIGLFILTSGFYGAAVAKTSSSTSASDSCAFYWYKSLAMGCSLNDYLVGFGYKYCKQFEKTGPQFTQAGQKNLARIRKCLIHAVQGNEQVTCSNVKSIALESHVNCYLENGFCDMSKADKEKIIRVVGRELLDPAFAAIAFRIQSHCLSAD